MSFTVLLDKELRLVFSSPIAYVIVAVFLALMGYTFTITLFLSKVASLAHLFFQMYVLFLLMVPAITMRLFAEERKTRTLELLLTSPVTELEIVLAKFVASMTLVVVMLALSGSYALVLGLYGAPDWAPIGSGYAGLLLVAATLVSLGLFASGLTANQIVAAITSMGLFLLLWMLDTLSYVLPAPFDRVALNAALVTHFTPFVAGALYLSDLGYFLSVTLLGFFLSVRVLARR